jgi:hypothetical protein
MAARRPEVYLNRREVIMMITGVDLGTSRVLAAGD